MFVTLCASKIPPHVSACKVFCNTFTVVIHRPQVALSRVVVRKHALEMLLTGDFINAERAAEIGLVNHVVDDSELEQAAREFAGKIAEKSQMAVRLGKASFYRQANQPLDSAYRSGLEDLVCNLLAEDGIEGLTAFIEKRKPQWQDR